MTPWDLRLLCSSLIEVLKPACLHGSLEVLVKAALGITPAAPLTYNPSEEDSELSDLDFSSRVLPELKLLCLPSHNYITCFLFL